MKHICFEKNWRQVWFWGGKKYVFASRLLMLNRSDFLYINVQLILLLCIGYLLDKSYKMTISISSLIPTLSHKTQCCEYCLKTQFRKQLQSNGRVSNGRNRVWKINLKITRFWKKPKVDHCPLKTQNPLYELLVWFDRNQRPIQISNIKKLKAPSQLTGH